MRFRASGLGYISGLGFKMEAVLMGYIGSWTQGLGLMV